MPTINKPIMLTIPVRRPRDWKYNYRELELGSTVNIIPEPDNVFDENALRIDDISGGQVGYVPAELAAKLAPKISSNNWFVLKARVAELDIEPSGWANIYIEITLGVPQE